MASNQQKFGRHSISIVAELTAHYLLSAGIIISLSIFLLHWGITSNIRKQSIQYMKDEITAIQKLFNVGSIDVLQRKITLSHDRQYAQVYFRILEADGKVFLESPRMGELLPKLVFPRPVPVEEPALHAFKRVSLKDKVYLTESLWLHVMGAPKVVQIGLDVSNMESSLTEYRLVLLLVLFFGIFLSGAAGRYIAAKGLRPVTAMASKCREISASKLGERIIPDRWPIELQELAGSLDEMLDRLQSSFDRLQNYSANLAHELRTPLANLMGEVEVALTRKRDIEEYERILESNFEEYQRLNAIVESLLFLAGADSREVKLRLENVSVNEEVENLHDFYEDYAKGRSFLIMCDPGTTVWADAALLRRALSNLIMNAIKYSPDGGMITIQADKLADGVMISVTDQGVGIDTEHLNHLYERFYRVPETEFLHKKGIGLGLSIVKSIMDLHGGTVSIDSKPMHGTRVTLTFPSP
jgi:two-component system heavy metal sensor histidine kinase CusS